MTTVDPGSAVGEPADAAATRFRRFELRRASSAEWIIADMMLPPAHPQRIVARVYEVDGFEFDVVWLRDIELRAQYASPQEVLEDVIRSVSRGSHPRWAKPTPIPHFLP